MATYQQALSCYFSSLCGMRGAKAQIKEIMFLWDFLPYFPFFWDHLPLSLKVKKTL